MVEAEGIGYNPIVWLESLFKRLVEASAGRGGIEAICQYLDQVDFIPELQALRRKIKLNSIFFETALSKCSKEMLKRPSEIRKEEIFNLLGSHCPKCGFTTSIWVQMETHGACPNCQSNLQPVYTAKLVELLNMKIDPAPEVVMMHVAYDKLAEAYVDCYKALKLVLEATAKIFGWPQFRIQKEELRNYMDEYFLGRLAGETKIPREEKQCLQFLVRGNLAGIPTDKAEKLIRLGLEVVKYGYLYEVLGATGAQAHYAQALAMYSSLYDKLNEEIRTTTAAYYSEPKRQIIHLRKTLGGYYAPCLLMDKQSWETGQIAKEVTLEPVYRLPIFPKSDFGALQTVYGRLGSGKTFLLNSIACYAVLAKHEVVFCPLNDKSNSLSLACMPLFAYNERTRKLAHNLQEVLGVEPQGIPTITLNILRRGEAPANIASHPPTIYDRIIEVDDMKSFEVDFNQIMSELKQAASDYGYSKPVGIITTRNLDRYNAKTNVNLDIQASSNMLAQFDKWRKANLSHNARVMIDEVSYLAPSQISLYGSDALKSGATISDFIKESRRSRVSVDLATQMPIEILPDIRNAATNIFFRDLAVSKDKSRSQIDFTLESMQLEDEALKDVVRDINNRGLLPKGFWFWYHQPSRTIQVIRPCPPTFCLHDIHLTPHEIIRKYEKATGEKMLLESWKQVETLKSTAKEKEKLLIR
ncbi:MAG: hypothetical protein ACPL4I_11430 [Bacteroidota bacterium]